MVWLLIAVCFSLLAGLAALPRVSAVLRLLLVAQAAYWTISYVVRPAVMQVARPEPALGDSIADPRIWAAGYEAGLRGSLWIVVVGLASYLLAVLFLANRPRMKSLSRDTFSDDRASDAEPFALLWLIGWAGRMWSLDSPGGVASTVGLFAALGSAGMLMFSGSTRWPSRDKVLLTAVLVGEISWAILIAAKTPIIAAALAVVLRQAISGWTRQATRGTLVIAAIIIIAFPTFQSIKLGQEESQGFSRAAEDRYPSWIQPALPLIRRFDQFAAVTDAANIAPNSWLSPSEAGSRAVLSLVPTPIGGGKESAGTLWNREVRSRTVPGSEESDVSLAEGFIAEGYALFGWAGIVLEAWLMALVTFLLAAGLRARSRLYLYWAILMLSFPIIFERGAFGTIELSAKALQVAVLCALIALMDHGLRLRREYPHRKTTVNNMNG